MKFLRAFTFIGLIYTSQVFASYEVIGETKDCAIKTKVIQTTSKGETSLLIIHESDVYALALKNQIGSMKLYTSQIEETESRFMTFEALIMGPEMSRLSELKIYLSGVMLNCLIEK